jgi:TetR/AcrR family transcriptional regulator
MDNIKNTSTEDKILHAAIAIFVKEGFAGARMQAIADKAEINKAMLHYYFRSKDQLFQKVFEISYSKMHPKLEKEVMDGTTVETILCKMIDVYMDFLKDNPYLPGLIISTINHNPEFLKKVPRSVPIALFEKINKAIESKEIKKIDINQLITSIISLCIAPYAAKKMMMHMSGINEKEFNIMMDEKKPFIKKLIKHMLHD